MPIDYRKYPKNWKEIREAVLKRAAYHCEFCGVEDRIWVHRNKKNGAIYVRMNNLGRELRDELWAQRYVAWGAPIKVVLTIAHLDHDVNHNDPKNLMALCQRCHLRWDKILSPKRKR